MYKIKLSPYAKIFYTEWQMDQTGSLYNIVIDQMLHGVIDIKKLKKALNRYVSEHVLLNSHIQNIDGEPYWVKNNNIVELEYLDSLPSKADLYIFC